MRVLWVGLRSLCYERKDHDRPLLITSAGPHLGSLSSRALVSAGCCGKLLPCLGLWGEPGLQTPAWIFFVTVYPSFSLPPLWSLFPNPLGPHKCTTLFLKKAPFFSLIIKLPRNNGCHLKQQPAKLLSSAAPHQNSWELPGEAEPPFCSAPHCELARGHCGMAPLGTEVDQQLCPLGWGDGLHK